MNIAIIDADLIARNKHRFPNLACMKLSAYYKASGNNVRLVTEYTDALKSFDKIFLSKVFTDTPVPEWVLKLGSIECGGTGFFYDKAPPLPHEIEHHMPDYRLYDEWVNKKLSEGGKRTDYRYYMDYSIGFTTRGCFRQCAFCVNKNYEKVDLHSPLSEFVSPERKKICLLDDNMLGSPHWESILEALQATGKPFQYKQGLDERLLTDEKCKALFKSNYDGDYIFAFDNISDYELVEKKLQLLRKYTNKTPKFYVFCGFDREDKWDDVFWGQDIEGAFRRIDLLARYQCLPYIMRYKDYIHSPFQGIYVNLARWCNQPSLFKKLTYREFCNKDDELKGGNSATKRYNQHLLCVYPAFERYFDIRFGFNK